MAVTARTGRAMTDRAVRLAITEVASAKLKDLSVTPRDLRALLGLEHRTGVRRLNRRIRGDACGAGRLRRLKVMDSRTSRGAARRGRRPRAFAGSATTPGSPWTGSVLVVDALGPELYDAIVASSAVICAGRGAYRSHGVPLPFAGNPRAPCRPARARRARRSGHGSDRSRVGHARLRGSARAVPEVRCRHPRRPRVDLRGHRRRDRRRGDERARSPGRAGDELLRARGVRVPVRRPEPARRTEVGIPRGRAVRGCHRVEVVRDGRGAAARPAPRHEAARPPVGRRRPDHDRGEGATGGQSPTSACTAHERCSRSAPTHVRSRPCAPTCGAASARTRRN